MPRKLTEEARFRNEITVPSDGDRNNIAGTIVDAFQHLADRTTWLKYKCENAIGAEGLIGATGPRGPQGERGERGERGEKGATGLTGDKGERGPAGDNSGATGATGEIGATGLTGATGPAGQIGPVGATGPRGERGERGERGPIGLTGQNGSIGPKGQKGDVGATGPTGATGEIGATGPAGPPGIDGTARVEVTACDYPFEIKEHVLSGEPTTINIHKCTSSLVDAKGENFKDVDVRLLNNFPGFIKLYGDGKVIVSFPQEFGVYESIIDCVGKNDIELENGGKWLSKCGKSICSNFQGKIHIRVVCTVSDSSLISYVLCDFLHSSNNSINMYEYRDANSPGIQVNFSSDVVGYVAYIESYPSNIIESKIYNISNNDVIIPFKDKPMVGNFKVSYTIISRYGEHIPPVEKTHGEFIIDITA